MEENKAEKKKRIHRKSGLEITSNGDGTCYISGVGTCRYADIVIPDECDGERVTGIGEQAFYKRENIVSVVIPESVTSIGELAFFHCENLTSIQFKGTSEQWETISKGDAWDLRVPAVIGFNFKEQPIVRGSKNKPIFRGGADGTDNKKSKLKIILAIVPIVLLLIGGIFFLSAPKDTHNHEYTAKITEPTCITQGFTTYTCACGESFIDEIKNAFGHKANEAPTCTKAQYCIHCDLELQAPLGHTPGEEATCTENSACTVCGEILQTANGHLSGNEATCTTAQKCTVCNAELKAALGHTPGAEATCTTSQNCTVCNTELKAAIGHKPGAEATCTTSQNCTVCNTELKAPLGHTPEWEIVTAATKTEDGFKVQKCSVCGAKLAEEVIPATGSIGLEFTSNGDGTCYVSGIGTCTDTDIVIPSVYNGMRVTSIGNSAFYSCDGLTSVTIPDSVTSIGNYAFEYCSGLTSITIPDSVTSIGDSAFRDCSGLTSVTLPFIGNTLDGISNTHFGYIFGASSYNLNYNYVPTSLKTVVITGGSSIGASAFFDCNGLTSITIPDSVTSIGYRAFEDCSKLTSVTIGDSVTSIGNGAFSYCRSLTSITIPDSVTSIGASAFTKCAGLTSITIPDSVTSIGSTAFYDCTGLTSVTIPDSMRSIGNSAFYGCSGLTSITFTGTTAQWSAISKDSYWKSKVPATQVICSDGSVSL